MSPRLVLFAVAVFCCIPGFARSFELLLDHQRAALSLAGTWSLLLEHGDREAWRPEIAGSVSPWKPVEVPGSLLLRPEGGSEDSVGELHRKTECVWLRRSFELTEEQASRDAVLKWGGIRFGAAAWVNGTRVTQHTPVGPHTVLLPRGLLRAGDNGIVLKISGWAGVPRSGSGYPLTPTGGATQPWGGKGPAVYQDIWIEFYDGAYLRHVLAMPDIDARSVTFRITLDGDDALPAEVDVTAEVREAGGGRVLSTESIRMVPDSERSTARVTCRLEAPKLWTPQTPQLYEARVRATAEGKMCDDMRFSFGMRQITIEDGHFGLNGEPLWLRGSNLVNEWLWGSTFNDNVKQYIVHEARSMSLNCFRTHTQPPPALWLDCADRYGTMILAEMPLLYNHGDFGYTPEEYEILHRNALLDATGWVTRMWNHPSIVMWVLSNESHLDNAWESGPLYEHVKSLDPTRPGMRTGEGDAGTPDMVDIHTCFNLAAGPEGRLIVQMAERMARKDPQRALTNTEYMNMIGRPARRWVGSQDHPDWPLVFAEAGAEHTEAMRRLQFDCILPYMYAGWTRLRGRMDWREDYPTPMAAALHSAMAPVLASLETFDRNYVAGQDLETGLALINETNGEVAARLDLYVTPRHPLFVPDAEALEAAVWHQSMPVRMPADSLRRRTVTVHVPEGEGTYYLAAVLTRDGYEPVVSQRALRAVDREKSVAGLAHRRVLLLGGNDVARSWLESVGCDSGSTARGGVDADVVLVWDAAEMLADEIAQGGAVRRFAETGGRVVVLDQTLWPWTALLDCAIGRPTFRHRDGVTGSRAHAFEDVQHPMLANVPTDWLWRWNGLPGTIVQNIIMDSPVLDEGRKLLWVSHPDYIAALALPVGEGEIIFCQLQIRRRLDPGNDSYDPVAERVLANLLRP